MYCEASVYRMFFYRSQMKSWNESKATIYFESMGGMVTAA